MRKQESLICAGINLSGRAAISPAARQIIDRVNKTPSGNRKVFCLYTLSFSAPSGMIEKRLFSAGIQGKWQEEELQMKGEKGRRILGALMLAAALLFFIYALGHPEGSFSTDTSTTYLLYAVFLIVALFFVFVPRKKR